MYLLTNHAILLFALLTLSNCNKKEDEQALWKCTYTLADIQSSNKFSLLAQNVIAEDLKEISGLAVGFKNENLVFMIEDQGNANEVHVFNSSGTFKTKLILEGVDNTDWEDIAIGSGPVEGESYVYIADMGDNNAVRTSVRIIRFIEPDLSGNHANSITVTNFDIVNFQYPSGARDAEALLVHPQTKDLIIMTKRDELTRVYKLEYPYNQSMNKAIFVGSLPFKKLVAGDISSDGQRVVVKNKSTIFYWELSENNFYKTIFQQAPKTITYIQEPQGESIAFSKDGKSYYTISETKDHAGAEPILYKYIEN